MIAVYSDKNTSQGLAQVYITKKMPRPSTVTPVTRSIWPSLPTMLPTSVIEQKFPRYFLPGGKEVPLTPIYLFLPSYNIYLHKTKISTSTQTKEGNRFFLLVCLRRDICIFWENCQTADHHIYYSLFYVPVKQIKNVKLMKVNHHALTKHVLEFIHLLCFKLFVAKHRK